MLSIISGLGDPTLTLLTFSGISIETSFFKAIPLPLTCSFSGSGDTRSILSFEALFDKLKRKISKILDSVKIFRF